MLQGAGYLNMMKKKGENKQRVDRRKKFKIKTNSGSKIYIYILYIFISKKRENQRFIWYDDEIRKNKQWIRDLQK